MTRFVLILVAFSSVLLAHGTDTVLNGKILTLDAALSTQQALAVRDGKIAATGTTAEIANLPAQRQRSST